MNKELFLISIPHKYCSIAQLIHNYKIMFVFSVNLVRVFRTMKVFRKRMSQRICTISQRMWALSQRTSQKMWAYSQRMSQRMWKSMLNWLQIIQDSEKRILNRTFSSQRIWTYLIFIKLIMDQQNFNVSLRLHKYNTSKS